MECGNLIRSAFVIEKQSHKILKRKREISMKKMKKILSIVLSFLLIATIIPWNSIMADAASLDSRVEAAIQWAISIANDDSHGYSQSNRNGPNYDCSSFVSTAFKNGGFSVSGSLTAHLIYSSSFVRWGL